ncbi:MAG: (Fe-S)-binding protein [Egibacteraceae bacterium]
MADHHHEAGAVVSETDQAIGFGAFDARRPPSAERIDDCVHCGFCLPTCPTYALWGEEMDSPRGRIYLMKLGLRGEVPMDKTFVGHFDACLGCMACVTSCPSGVRYNELIESTRAQIERNWTRGRSDEAFRRLIFALFPHRSRLRVAAVLGWLYQRARVGALLRRSGAFDRLTPRLQALEALLPAITLRDLRRRVPHVTPAVGSTRRRVGLLTGCVQSVFFADVNEAARRVLAAEGCEVVAPPSQGCCGALELHAGVEDAALARAKAMIDVFEEIEVDAIVVTAAGCGSAMKEYGHLLRDDPEHAERAAAFSAKVADVTELLAELEPRAVRHPVRARVAYHDACHLRHAQRVTEQPRALLRAIPGLELVPIAEPDICCGSAGVYNLVQPEPAAELGQRKASHILAARPDAVATANPGCLLQLRRYLPGMPLAHPVQILDCSLQGKDPPW